MSVSNLLHPKKKSKLTSCTQCDSLRVSITQLVETLGLFCGRQDVMQRRGGGTAGMCDHFDSRQAVGVCHSALC